LFIYDSGYGFLDKIVSAPGKFVENTFDLAKDVFDWTFETVGEIVEEGSKLIGEAVEVLPNSLLFAAITVATSGFGGSLAAFLSKVVSRGAAIALLSGYAKLKREEAYEKYKKAVEAKLREQEIALALEAPLFFILVNRYAKKIERFKHYIQRIEDTPDGTGVVVVLKGLGSEEAKILGQFLENFIADVRRLLQEKVSAVVDKNFVKLVLEYPQKPLSQYLQLRLFDKLITEMKKLIELGIVEIKQKDNFFVEVVAPKWFIDRWSKYFKNVKQWLAWLSGTNKIVISKSVMDEAIRRFPNLVDALAPVVHVVDRGTYVELIYPKAYSDMISYILKNVQQVGQPVYDFSSTKIGQGSIVVFTNPITPQFNTQTQHIHSKYVQGFDNNTLMLIGFGLILLLIALKD